MTQDEIIRLKEGLSERPVCEYFDDYLIIGIPADCPEQFVPVMNCKDARLRWQIEDQVIRLAQAIIAQRHQQQCQADGKN